jgi:hypothetical protein
MNQGEGNLDAGLVGILFRNESRIPRMQRIEAPGVDRQGVRGIGTPNHSDLTGSRNRGRAAPYHPPFSVYKGDCL